MVPSGAVLGPGLLPLLFHLMCGVTTFVSLSPGANQVTRHLLGHMREIQPDVVQRVLRNYGVVHTDQSSAAPAPPTYMIAQSPVAPLRL
jgi:hypothetical protein